MWKIFANIILRYRILILILISVVTVYMAYNAKNIELDYNYAALLPKTDTNYIEFDKFKQIFGEDANISIIGIQDKNFFELDKFNDWLKLQKKLTQIKGVEHVLSISSSIDIYKNQTSKKFEIINIFPEKVKTQTELDSLAKVFKSKPFYDGLIYNDSNGVILMAITMNKEIINSKAREKMIEDLENESDKFGQKYNLKVHYSGLPYSRTKISLLIRNELYMFIFLAMLVTASILFLFFRSFKVVMFSMLIVGIGVIWAMGSIALFGYKITILTGMIPPLIIVIGIPNSVYLLNKYHSEYKKHSNKIKALYRIIRKVGNATFLTNLTTALGFATFVITGNRFLVEFGIVASLNIMGVFILSITLIPIFFSYLSPPKERHIKHLDYKYVNAFIERLVCIVNNRRKAVYAIVISVVLISIFGTTLIKTEGFIVDDIPHDEPIYVDLKFLENNIGGVMPLEITIDTKKKKGVYKYSTLKKMDQFIKSLEKYKDLSKSTSIIDALKFSRQAYFNGREKSYKLPSKQELTFIMPYLPDKSSNSNFNILESFVDSTASVARISYRLNDVGTIKNKEIADSIAAEAGRIFSDEKYKVTVTGSSIVFTQGTSFLVKNLFTSLTLAIALIAFFMATMFTSLRMIIISLIPNFIPLLFTASIMGYFHIPIKPSTVLVFSIAFGISVDNAIHFLAKYRQELFVAGGNIKLAAIVALRETGVSIIYTAGILFFGFGIFTISKFGGTQALGLLVSITLLVAMLSNLILLPSLLLTLKHSTTKSFTESFKNEFEELEANDNNDFANCK
ncbi:MAG: MMPL family transporter [Bacteroidales bacterium]|nr:MMPL family transporter [Bacteroidales bacterium]MBN2756714.1 MMPL family transporter [Bacteroidales bacterium]